MTARTAQTRALLGRAKRGTATLAHAARVQKSQLSQRGTIGRLEAQAAAQRSHVRHIEERLHAAEHTLSELAEEGLLQPLSADPASFARWLTWRPPGHFYSAVPNLHDLERDADAIWPAAYPAELPGIDLNAQGQLAAFAEVARLAREHEVFPEKTEPWRYYSDNVSYGVGDALMLHGMLRRIKPKRLIEVGSGHSSAMTLDTVEHYLDGNCQLTFVEPYPELLHSLLRPGDHERVTIVPTALQDVSIDLFRTLESGDILFIDSTHVLKTGSDVVWLYTQILPSLRAGVVIHIHDIFYPFEYPRAWVMEGRAWTEAYIVRAFLTNNSDFDIELFNTWVAYFHHDQIAEKLPSMLANTGGSLWLRRSAVSRPKPAGA